MHTLSFCVMPCAISVLSQEECSYQKLNCWGLPYSRLESSRTGNQRKYIYIILPQIFGYSKARAIHLYTPIYSLHSTCFALFLPPCFGSKLHVHDGNGISVIPDWSSISVFSYVQSEWSMAGEVYFHLDLIWNIVSPREQAFHRWYQG